ncbi:MAG: Fic family protein [bacterium]|nr:Fic family protein [bacterium]
MTEEKKRSLHPTSEVLVEVYKTLEERKDVSFPIHDEQIFKLDSIVKTVNAEYFGFVRFPEDEDKASAYFCFIIKGHPVTDGNKRLAVLWLDMFCHFRGIRINENVRLDELAVGVEKVKDIEMGDLIKLVKVILFEISVNTP